MLQANAKLPDWLTEQRLDPALSLSDSIYAQLRLAIVSGRLAAEAVIQEPQIASHFGVSRTPVREALLRLRADALVEIRKQAGTFVAPVDPMRVEEGILVRDALEPRVIELSATRLSERQMLELETLTREMERAGRQGDGTAFIAADDQFHEVLIDAAGMPHIAEIIGRVNAQLDRVRHLSSTHPTRVRESVREHRALIRALRNRDASASGQLLHEHLQASWTLLRRILDGQDETS